MNKPLSGPSLDTYLETRFNLHTVNTNERLALLAKAIEVAKEAADRERGAQELRYQQRFEAQSAATATAFGVAEKAVQSALAAADRAVSKAEIASDKRFEALNELRQMLNDMVGTLITRVEALQRLESMAERLDTANARTDRIEQRLNLATGEETGRKTGRDDTKSLIAVAVSVVAVLITAGGMLFSGSKSAPTPTSAVVYVPAPSGALLPSAPPVTQPR